MADAYPSNFDSVAGIYRWAEYFALGPILQHTRVHFIPQLADRRSAFVLGDGDGRFLAALLSANRDLHAHAVDTSARMLSLLRGRCCFAMDRLRTVHGSAMDVAPPSNTDLIVTHFFLDCLEQSEVETVAQRLAAGCAPGTLWLVSDFQLPINRVLRLPARAYIRLLYFAFKRLTGLRVQQLPDPRSVLRRVGFERVAYHQTLAGMIYTELWQLTASDKMTNEAGRNPNSEEVIHKAMASPAQDERPAQPFGADPVPNPEPAVPSLQEPDACVYHHEPGFPRPQAPAEGKKPE